MSELISGSSPRVGLIGGHVDGMDPAEYKAMMEDRRKTYEAEMAAQRKYSEDQATLSHNRNLDLIARMQEAFTVAFVVKNTTAMHASDEILALCQAAEITRQNDKHGLSTVLFERASTIIANYGDK